MTRLVLVVSALALLAAFAVAQASSYARQPLVAEVAPYGAEIARETSCGSLRIRWTQELSVWKGGVRDGHDAMVEPHLNAMRAILRRLQALDDQGACGG